MYLPRIFEETDTATLHDLVEAYPFAMLVAPGDDAPEIAHLPLLLERDAAERWSLDLLAPAFVDDLLSAIAGFTLTIERLEGKLKLSQNRAPDDRARVIAALDQRGAPDDLAMAARMRRSTPRA